jgi:hypothetical protein
VERACPQCGAALAADQAYCLECGAATPGERSFRPPRTVGLVALALGIVAVAASAAYGITMDAKPGHRHQLIGLAAKPPPPAPAPPPAAPPASATATPPPAPKPPKVKPAPPAPKVATPAPPAIVPHTSGGGGSTPAPSTPSHHHSHSSSPKHSGTGSSNGSAGFSTGDTPTDAQVFPPGSPGSDKALRAADDDPGTSWSTSKAGTGIYVDAGGYTTYTSLGLVTKTPGYSVQIYATTQDPPPGTQTDPNWTLVGSQTNVSSRQKIKVKQLPSGDARYYLIWITKLPSKGSAGISEVALLQ